MEIARTIDILSVTYGDMMRLVVSIFSKSPWSTRMSRGIDIEDAIAFECDEVVIADLGAVGEPSQR